MATTNLNTQSIGDILIESGNGSPDHISPIGSYYTNEDSGTIYLNSTGTVNGWASLNRVSYGDMYIQDNTTNTTGTSNWVSLTGLTWTFDNGNGVEMEENGRLKVQTKRGGTYYVLATASLQIQNGTSDYDFYMGVSKNGDIPGPGFYNYATCDGNLSASVASEDSKCITVSNIISLSDGDTVEMCYRGSSATPDARLMAGTITLNRVRD